jgi:HSP90 family molecular chaperone
MHPLHPVFSTFLISYASSQIFYLAEVGKEANQLAESVFIEKLDARGYEVLLLTEPLDEIMFGNLREWKWVFVHFHD